MKPAMTVGEILLEDYLVPMSISQNTLARALGISPRSINEIVLVYSSNQGLHRVSGLSINDNKLKTLGWTAKANFDDELDRIVEYYTENFIW